MSSPAERRVRRVRLRAADEALVRRGAILLEDALHTASLPEAEGGRLLVVRSLAVGRIRGSQSPASLALAIERRLREVWSVAVHAEDPSARDAPVVYFRDAAEPFVLLLVRVARQEDTAAWFWPLAAPGWRPDLPRDEGLRVLLDGVGRTPAGAAATAVLLQTLHERGALDPLLSALRSQEGPSLLRACGWTPPAGPPGVGGEEVGPVAGWLPVLEQWVGRWGTQDARSVWLAALVLAIDRPGRLLDPRHLDRARGLVARVASAVASGPPPRPRRPAHEEVSGAACAAGPPAEVSGPAALASPEAPGAAAPTVPLPPAPPRAEVTGPAAEVTHPTAPREGRATGPPAVGREAPPLAESRPPPAERRNFMEPRPTEHAGLFFLLPALERLGIVPWLESNPRGLEVNLPGRILGEAARALGVPDEDPVWAALPGTPSGEEAAPWEFAAPACWQELCGAGPRVVRRLTGGGARLLSDRPGQLVLALWRGRAPAAVRQFLGGQWPRTGSAAAPASDFAVLLGAWLTALRRWCHLHARMGLAAVVSRPGRVAVTRTHVDVLFPHHLADVRVRRAGLDLDPGWLPWFGRVVQFHYQYGG